MSTYSLVLKEGIHSDTWADKRKRSCLNISYALTLAHMFHLGTTVTAQCSYPVPTLLAIRQIVSLFRCRPLPMEHRHKHYHPQHSCWWGFITHITYNLLTISPSLSRIVQLRISVCIAYRYAFTCIWGWHTYMHTSCHSKLAAPLFLFNFKSKQAATGRDSDPANRERIQLQKIHVRTKRTCGWLRWHHRWESPLHKSAAGIAEASPKHSIACTIWKQTAIRVLRALACAANHAFT